MKINARPFIVIAVYMCALLAFIGAFIVFMRMQEETGEIEKFRTQGMVSRAVVTEKKEDTISRTDRTSLRPARRSERTTHSPINVVHVRFEPRSTVAFADLGTRVRDDELPAAPPPTGNVMTDSRFSGVMWVSDETFAAINVGDVIVVVNTPFNRSFPRPVSEVRAFDQTGFYPWLIGFVLLGAGLVLLGRRISRGGKTGSGA